MVGEDDVDGFTETLGDFRGFQAVFGGESIAAGLEETHRLIRGTSRSSSTRETVLRPTTEFAE